MNNDISAWRVDENDFVLPWFDDGCDAVNGMDELVQRVMCVLLTEPQSARYSFGRSVERACPFISAWRHGDINTEADVFGQFRLSKSYIVAALRAEAVPDDPPEQRLTDLDLVSIDIQPDVVCLEIVLITEAGRKTIKLPIPT